MDEQEKHCEDCGSTGQELFETVYNTRVCLECKNEFYVVCSDCDRLVVEEDTVEKGDVDEGVLCPTCLDDYEFCKSCGRPFLLKVGDALEICEDCKEEI